MQKLNRYEAETTGTDAGRKEELLNPHTVRSTEPRAGAARLTWSRDADAAAVMLISSRH